MKKTIEIIRRPSEEPYHVNLIVKASNGESTGQIEIYDHADRFKELADILEDFPFRKIRKFKWELGSEKPEDRFAFYFKCEFSLIELSSVCVIQIRFNNNETGVEKSISEFSICCLPNELNILGQLFREFSKLEKETLIWNGLEGDVK